MAPAGDEFITEVVEEAVGWPRVAASGVLSPGRPTLLWWGCPHFENCIVETSRVTSGSGRQSDLAESPGRNKRIFISPPRGRDEQSSRESSTWSGAGAFGFPGLGHVFECVLCVGEFKLRRARGGCLGAEGRGRTRQAAKRFGELQSSFDPKIS